jgi:hypothetical protein
LQDLNILALVRSTAGELSQLVDEQTAKFIEQGLLEYDPIAAKRRAFALRMAYFKL